MSCINAIATGRSNRIEQEIYRQYGRREEKGKRVNVARVEELVATGADTVGVACPFCQSMFRDALGQMGDTRPKLLDVAQIAAAAIH
ncbi:MAG: hypothetical protein ACR2I2_23220 [Bryobacteraceae bacterium]